MKIFESRFGLAAVLASILGLALTQTSFTPRSELPCLEKKFSVQVHIVLDSLGQPNVTEADIVGQFSAINPYWDEICVEFEVCNFNYIPNAQWDTLDAIGGFRWDQMLTAHHESYRINVFYVQACLEPPGIAGFADLGGITNTQGGGICILKPGSSGTLAHEMGHYWGLSHPFEETGPELVDGSNCETAGDGICDTPADPYIPFLPSSDYETDCIFDTLLQDINGDWYDPDVGNIMSYYDCACHFSYQQYQRMAAVYSNNLSPNGTHMW